MGGPVWRGGEWEFFVHVCPVCHAQLWPEGDEYSIECYGHDRLVAGIEVHVYSDAGAVLAQLGQPRAAGSA